MTEGYTLENLFNEYKFTGQLEGDDLRGMFAMTVFTYSPKSHLFIASGEFFSGTSGDAILSALQGMILPKDSLSASITMRQCYSVNSSSSDIYYEGLLRKTTDGPVINATGETKYKTCKYNLSLKAERKRNLSLISFDERGNAMSLVLPNS